MSASNANIQISDNTMGLGQDDVVVIADCQNADMFRITNAANGGGNVTLTHANSTNTTNRLSAPYNTDAQIMFFESVAYYIAATGRQSEHGEPINALYRFTDNMSDTVAPTFIAEELIEGVDSMQILYGERLATGNLRYVTADNVANMQLVESIQLGLLLSGSRSILQADDESSYTLPGELIVSEGTVGADVTHTVDRRLRRDYSLTINLRNRRTQ